MTSPDSGNAFDSEILDLRKFRLRQGWTQGDLAEKLHVDQGTVSRWERGVEKPWPTSYAAIRDLIRQSDTERLNARVRALLEADMYSAMFLDESGYIRKVSRKCKTHYDKRHSFNIVDHIGMPFRRHADLVERKGSGYWFERSRLLKGDVMFMRVHTNIKGKISSNIYEPIFEGGEVSGCVVYLQGQKRIQENSDVSIERVEVIHCDTPGQAVLLHEGARSYMLDDI